MIKKLLLLCITSTLFIFSPHNYSNAKSLDKFVENNAMIEIVSNSFDSSLTDFSLNDERDDEDKPYIAKETDIIGYASKEDQSDFLLLPVEEKEEFRKNFDFDLFSEVVSDLYTTETSFTHLKNMLPEGIHAQRQENGTVSLIDNR